MDWLLLAALGIMWVAFLVPVGLRRSEAQSVEDFERRMELLAHAEVHGTNGRWIVTPRKGVQFLGPQERRKARLRERRRRVFVFLSEGIGFTLLVGMVPPLRALWAVSAVLGALLATYIWLLLTIKHRAGHPHDAARAANAPVKRAVPAPAKYVADGLKGWARPTFNGLGSLGEGDSVHVVVRSASAG